MDGEWVAVAVGCRAWGMYVMHVTLILLVCNVCMSVCYV